MNEEEEDSYHPVFRNGRVHVLAEKCKSCIFRSVNDGRILGLDPGRVAGMVVEARANDSVIPCHSTIHRANVEPAICRGYFDLARRPQVLDIADRIGIISYDKEPDGK